MDELDAMGLLQHAADRRDRRCAELAERMHGMFVHLPVFGRDYCLDERLDRPLVTDPPERNDCPALHRHAAVAQCAQQCGNCTSLAGHAEGLHHIAANAPIGVGQGAQECIAGPRITLLPKLSDGFATGLKIWMGEMSKKRIKRSD